MSAAVDALLAELDLRAAAGDPPVRLWLRDDDASAPGPALNRLAALAERFALPVLLATIPMLATPALSAELAGKPILLPCQHGAWHRNHAPAGGKKSEFGAERPWSAVAAELRAGRQRLSELFGERLLPVFVPPWNRIDPQLASRLPELGFTGLSCFRGFRLGATPGLTVANTDLDIMDWQGGRIGRSLDAMAAELALLLAARRGAAEARPALGLLLHHLDHDDAGWAALEGLLLLLTRHPAIAPADPRAVFGLGHGGHP